ncbi:YcfL family protein [Ferrimonas gelatinilytica]|uniref:YcfL family protein n=1 Tax=Ferrimonas gelatinilytica TaxID=1255257 RepID=A0ABP9RWU1_9GAMM
MKRGITLLCVLTLCGCSAMTAGIAARSDEPNLRVDSTSVARQVSIEQVRKRRLNDRLQGSALLVSRITRDSYLQYKFTFFDREGLVVEGESSSWRPVNLHGGEQRQVTATALRPEAVEFEIALRRVTDE